MSFFVVDQISVSKKGTDILKDISFSAEKGELVSILGPSGCGKTTLINSILGFESFSGKIELNGSDISFLRPDKRGFSAVFQGLNLFPHLSVAENILYGISGKEAGFKKEKLSELINLTQLNGRENDGISQLSGGERQRVAIARSLATEPQLIFFDEPFSSLDRHLRIELRRFIKKVLKQKGIGAFLVTHDKDDAFHFSDQVIIMNNGDIVQKDTPENLFYKPNCSFVGTFFSDASEIKGQLINTFLLKVCDESKAKMSGAVDDCYFNAGTYCLIIKGPSGRIFEVSSENELTIGEKVYLTY